MRSFQLLAFASVLATSSIVACAGAIQSAHAQQTESEEPSEFDAYDAALRAKDYETALRIASKIELKDTKEARGFRSALRGAALLGLKRDAEAQREFAEADRLAPNEPTVVWLKLEAGMRAERIDMMTDAVDVMIARFPDQAREINQDAMWYILRKEPKDQAQRNDDRRVALARIGFGGSQGDYLTQDAVKILLKRGDRANASDLLQYIDEPTLIEDMLTQKQYSAVWPTLETMAGPHLAKIRTASAEAAERDYQADPSSENLHILVNALRHAGRLDEAIALRSKLPANGQAMASADEAMGWAINNVALALHEAGRGDEADALFASLNGAKIERPSWRVSMVINRLELLVGDGKFSKANELLAATESTSGIDGSPYAKQLVRRLKYCIASGLGRKQEAAKALPDMVEHAKDAYHASIDGLLCAGDIEQAEKLALAAMSDDTFQEQFVRAVQPVALTSDDPSVWNNRWKELRQRPAIAKEFERLGRDMPGNLVPPAAKSS